MYFNKKQNFESAFRIYKPLLEKSEKYVWVPSYFGNRHWSEMKQFYAGVNNRSIRIVCNSDCDKIMEICNQIGIPYCINLKEDSSYDIVWSESRREIFFRYKEDLILEAEDRYIDSDQFLKPFKMLWDARFDKNAPMEKLIDPGCLVPTGSNTPNYYGLEQMACDPINREQRDHILRICQYYMVPINESDEGVYFQQEQYPALMLSNGFIDSLPGKEAAEMEYNWVSPEVFISNLKAIYDSWSQEEKEQPISPLKDGPEIKHYNIHGISQMSSSEPIVIHFGPSVLLADSGTIVSDLRKLAYEIEGDNNKRNLGDEFTGFM